MTWHAFDGRGWYTGPVADDTPGAVPVPPPIDNTDETPDEPRARWARTRWVVLAYVPPPAPPPPPPSWDDDDLDPRYHWIDVGSFMDRFGPDALAVASSTDPEVQGLLTLLLPRRWVDLLWPELPAMVGMLVAKELITEQRAADVLSPITTEAERHISGMPQPTTPAP